jgi:hypothetical protein
VRAYLTILGGVLQIIGILLDSARRQRAFQAGMDAEAARHAAAIALKSKAGKQYLAEFAAKPGSADDFLRGLEPKDPAK